MDQFETSLKSVIALDEPADEYDLWIANSETTMRSWKAINLDDKVQIQQLWSALRFEMVVVNFFLNQFVFPKEAKQVRPCIFHPLFQLGAWLTRFSRKRSSSVAAGIFRSMQVRNLHDRKLHQARKQARTLKR